MPAGVGRGAMVSGGARQVTGQAVVVGAVVVVERRNGKQCFRIEGVHPGKVYEGIAFMLAITQADAWVLGLKAILRNARVFYIVRKRVIRNLVEILA